MASGTRSTPRGVFGVYRDLESARKGIHAVEGKGVEADRIRLVGGPAEEAAGETDVSVRDTNVAGFIERETLMFGIVGTVVGAVLGLLAGALMHSRLWIFALVGAIAIGLFGWVLGGYAKLGATEDWELTFQPEEQGQVAVAVRSSDEATLNLAAQALRDSGAVKVSRA